MRTWRKQLHTPDHRPLLVIVEPILTRLEAGNDRMPCCRRMLGRMLARRTVTATDVSTLHAATEMKPPAFGRRQAFDTPIAARLRNGIDSALLFFDSQFPSVSWQPNSASSCAPSATSRSSELASSADLARDLPQVVSEPIFDIPGLVEAALHQRFDSILCGRSPSEAMHASHPAPSSTSGGRLVSTRRLVWAIAHLSNLAIRVASASTKASSSASGSARFTYP